MKRVAPVVLLVICGLLSLAGCQAPSTEGHRVAVIRYAHETCTFCPGGDTEIEGWTQFRPHLTREEVLSAGN